MKIAHLILVHKNPAQLKRLVSALTHPSFDIYIHVDAKADQRQFESALLQTTVQFINKRAKIYWGDWGTIQATLNGFMQIGTKNYQYINVISGQDFPIKPVEDILRFLQANIGREFITCHPPEGAWGDAKSRISEYHFINMRLPFRHRLEKIFTALLPKRKFPLDYEIVGRANWFTLSADAIQYCLSFLATHPAVVQYFKLCWGADEFIFSTILYNSPFREKIQENVVFVDWDSGKRGHPKTLDMNDFPTLSKSPKLFARKFDMHCDPIILDEVEHKLLGSGQRTSAIVNAQRI